MDPVLHVFIRYENVLRCTPATTATTSFMEWSGHVWQRSLVCSPAADLDESNLDAPSTYHRLSSFIAVDLQVGDYRCPDGREYRGTWDPQHVEAYWLCWLSHTLILFGNCHTKVERWLHARLRDVSVLFCWCWQGLAQRYQSAQSHHTIEGEPCCFISPLLRPPHFKGTQKQLRDVNRAHSWFHPTMCWRHWRYGVRIRQQKHGMA